VASIGLGPDGDIYLSDSNRNGIRKVDPNSGIITTWMSADTSGVSLAIGGCQWGNGCQIAWDGSGHAFVSSRLYGPSSSQYGIMQTDLAGNNRVLIAGNSAGSTANGVATSAVFGTVPKITFATVATVPTIFLSDSTQNLVRTIAAGNITTVAGNGTAGFTGDYGPGTSAELNGPSWIAVTPGGHILISDSTNYAVREVW
jgi:hypothetical protein